MYLWCRVPFTAEFLTVKYECVYAWMLLLCVEMRKMIIHTRSSMHVFTQVLFEMNSFVWNVTRG